MPGQFGSGMAGIKASALRIGCEPARATIPGKACQRVPKILGRCFRWLVKLPEILIALEMSLAGSLSATPVFNQRFLILSKTAVASAKGIATQAAFMVAMGSLNAWCQ